MKKRIICTATVLALSISTAYADPAVIINVDGPACTLFDGNGALVTGNHFRVVATQSKNGNATVRCEGDVTPASGGGAATFDFGSTGVSCVFGTPFGPRITQDWHETVSASGNGKITCHDKL
jgi:hypothetical protein